MDDDHLFAMLSLIVVPATVVGLAAALSRRWGGITGSLIEVATRFAYGLVPLGSRVAVPLQLPLFDELGNRLAGSQRSFRISVRSSSASRVPMRLLSARRRLAGELAVLFLTPVFCCRSTRVIGSHAANPPAYREPSRPLRRGSF